MITADVLPRIYARSTSKPAAKHVLRDNERGPTTGLPKALPLDEGAHAQDSYVVVIFPLTGQKVPSCYSVNRSPRKALGRGGTGSASFYDDEPTTVQSAPARLASAELPVGQRRAERDDNVRSLIFELTRRAGLELSDGARLFDVSLDIFAGWASGFPMPEGEIEQLNRLLHVVRSCDRGFASLNRRALFHTTPDGTAFERLRLRDYARAEAMLGKGASTEPASTQALSESARLDRLPIPPLLLLDARHDTVHVDHPSATTTQASRSDDE